MFPSTNSAKNAVDMFPRTDILKWHSFYPLKPCWDGRIAVKGDRLSVRKTLIYQGFSQIWAWNPLRENIKLSLRGNKSIKAVFDSQVVRLDVIAPRVVGLDVRLREWSG